jgi:biopolymer transport protein ExbD
MAISAKNKVDVNFSLSGMTDIVFLLLLFFMLASTLVIPVAMNVMLPQSNNQTSANPIVTVSITKNLEYMVDEKVCSFDQVESVLKEKLGNPKEPPTFRLNADESLYMDEIYNILDVAKRNRYKVILGTRPM